MAIKVIIERKVLPGQERNVLELLRSLRSRCLDEPGYITGETLRDSEDPYTLLVISTWFGLLDWRRWHASEERKEFESKLRAYLSGPEKVHVYIEGLSDLHSGA